MGTISGAVNRGTSVFAAGGKITTPLPVSAGPASPEMYYFTLTV